jgi:hypothetical protein
MKKIVKVTTVYGGQKSVVAAISKTAKRVRTANKKTVTVKRVKKPEQENVMKKIQQLVKTSGPVVMAYSKGPDGKMGPYCQVKIPYKGKITTTVGHKEVATEDGKTKSEPIMGFKRLRGIPIGVRVVRGDNMNGSGFVVEPDQRIPLLKYGVQLEWAGGTKESLARAKTDQQVNPFSS